MKKLIASLAVVIMLGAVSGAMAATTYGLFDNMNQVGTWTNYGSNAADNLTSPVNSGYDGAQPGVVWSYSDAVGAWSGLKKESLGGLDWSNMVALKFYMKGTGASNSLWLQLTDINGQQVHSALSQMTNNAAWTPVVVATTSFTTSATFNWSKIDKIEFMVPGIVDGTAGTMSVDDIETGMYTSGAAPSIADMEVSVTIVNAGVSVTITGGPVTFGQLTAGTPGVVCSAPVSVTYNGTGNVTYKLNLTNPPGWTADSAASANHYILQSAFSAAAGGITWSANDNLTTAGVPCSATQFAGDTTGVAVPANTAKSLWFRFTPPTSVSNAGTAQTIDITVTAVPQ